jgi:cyanophycinase
MQLRWSLVVSSFILQPSSLFQEEALHVSHNRTGTLIIIGGHEDKTGEQEILKQVTKRAGSEGDKLVIATVATSLPEEVAAEYTAVFKKLGVKHIAHLDVRNRRDAYQESNIEALQDAAVVFFTGGDQLRITAHLGDSPVYSLIQEIYDRGGVIAGTSAGASVMSETMMVSGAQEESNVIGDLRMAPGLGLLKGVVVDQHFAERGRIGRLIAAVAQNPRNLGVGIDENTAIVLENQASFTVAGSGAVYVVDGTDISDTNLAEGDMDEVLSCFDIRLHVLKAGQQFNIDTRRPSNADREVIMPVGFPGDDDLQREGERRARARDATDGHR